LPPLEPPPWFPLPPLEPPPWFPLPPLEPPPWFPLPPLEPPVPAPPVPPVPPSPFPLLPLLPALDPEPPVAALLPLPGLLEPCPELPPLPFPLLPAGPEPPRPPTPLEPFPPRGVPPTVDVVAVARHAKPSAGYSLRNCSIAARDFPANAAEHASAPTCAALAWLESRHKLKPAKAEVASKARRDETPFDVPLRRCARVSTLSNTAKLLF
jgi:hypothetical protein